MNQFKKLFKIVVAISIIIGCLILILNIASYFQYFNIKFLNENQNLFNKCIFIPASTTNEFSETSESLSNEELDKIKIQQDEIDNQAEIISIWQKREVEWKRTEQTYLDRINTLENENLNNQMLVKQLTSKEKGYKDMALYFNQMNAKKAADIASQMDNNLIIGIMSKMEKEAAAELLENISVEKAAAISRQMLEVAP